MINCCWVTETAGFPITDTLWVADDSGGVFWVVLAGRITNKDIGVLRHLTLL